MSAPEATLERTGHQRSEYGTIVVIGGGCYGSYYVRQLRRAAAAGAVRWQRVVVVDRDPHCKIAAEFGVAGGPPTSESTATSPSDHHHPIAPLIEIAEWRDFLAGFLGAAADRPDDARLDAIVPSPLMPHLFLEWLIARSRHRWPDRPIELRGLDANIDVPWQQASPSGIHVASFAEWTCPVNCIEPAKCPVTRGPRDWSMPHTLRRHVTNASPGTQRLGGPVIFHCEHRTYGVGMIDVSDIVASENVVAEAVATGLDGVLVGTVSHCHGALGVLATGRAA